MNTRRQTIWLVSMLSLMVILSAYYLFTDDVNKHASTVDTSATSSNVKVNDTTAATDQAAASTTDKTVASTTDKTAAGTTDKTAASTTDTAVNKDTAQSSDTSGKKTASANTGADAKSGSANQMSDNQILSQVSDQQTSASDQIAAMQLQRNDEMTKEMDRLTAIINENKNDNDVLKANDDLKKLEEKDALITNLEESLQQDFHDAMVKEEGNKWRVIVQAAKLEKSQAVSIIDLVIKDMNVTADKVIVQHLP